MKLVHYSNAPVGSLRIREQPLLPVKPCGLWVSDDDCEDNWFRWCIDEKFRLYRLACAHDIELVRDANVLVLASRSEIDAFTREWISDRDADYGSRGLFLRWRAIRERYAGLIITPYIWSARLEVMWYYGWDCASGCIWDPSAIASIQLRETAQLVPNARSGSPPKPSGSDPACPDVPGSVR